MIPSRLIWLPVCFGILVMIAVVNPVHDANGQTQDYRSQPTYDEDCKQRPKGSVCIQYTDGYVWLVNDSILDWSSDKSANVQIAEGLKAYYYHILKTDLIKMELKGDIDGDGIPNKLDMCPQKPENYNKFEDSDGCPDSIPVPTNIPLDSITIPEWIKKSAGWWANGDIDDKAFVQGIQFLIKEGIMKIPPTTSGDGLGGNEIPEWIKKSAGWWANGDIDDKAFVQGIQFLIKEGIMKISS